MHSAITVSLVTEAKGGPFVFWDGLAHACERAARLGFDAIEIFPPEYYALEIAEVRSVLKDHQLRLAAVGTGAGWVVHRWHLCHPDAQVRTDADVFISDMLFRAARLDAPVILGSMQGRVEGGVSRDAALVWLRDAIEHLSDAAARRGQHFLYEPLNRYETNLFNRLGDAAQWLRTIDAPNVRLLADLFHMNIEEASISDAIREAGPLIGHVHFADSNRRAVGLGHTDMEPIMQALRDIGFDGYLSAEVLPLPDSETAARQTIESFHHFAGR